MDKFVPNQLIPKYKYNFINKKNKYLTNKVIYNAELKIDRAKVIFELNKLFMNIELAMAIELGIFEFALIYMLTNNLNDSLIESIYIDKYSNIMANLTEKHINNETLMREIQNKTYDPQMIAFLSLEQIHPKKMELFIKKQKIKAQREANVYTTDTYTCPKCKEKKCTVLQVQTRSADEPPTLFITCTVCYYAFKKG